MKGYARAGFLWILILVCPMALAHTLEISATVPFPSKVAATTKTLAVFTVKNISNTPLIAEDISDFKGERGLKVVSSTCGEALAPHQTCTIELSLDAKWTHERINSELKIWAKPRADIVRYPIHVKVTHSVPKITLEPISQSVRKPQLQKFREPIIAEYEGKWLILSGSHGEFHDFDNDFNTDIYVYDPKTQKIKSVVIAHTDLPEDVKKQLSSSVPVFLQDHDTMHIIGGFYNNTETIPSTFTTLNTMTLIDIPGMMKAVEQGHTHLKRFVAYCSENTSTPCPDNFQVTGGQLGKIGHYLYLTFGHNCEGRYCAISQVYSNAIYKFIAKPNYHDNTVYIKNIDSVVHQDDDGSGWRRRDFSLTPFKWYGADSLLAMAGPFTPGDPNVWTNGIMFNKEIDYDSQFMSQQGNQYANAHLAMYSERNDHTYVATFAGLSNLYWSPSKLQYDDTTPYGNILDLISSDAAGHVREYVNMTPMCSGKPLVNCLYMGIGTAFIPVEHYFDHRDMLMLDKLPPFRKTLVGYLYGGLISYSQEPFDDSDETQVTNQLYGVYVQPHAQGKVYWQNVTNAYTQTQ